MPEYFNNRPFIESMPGNENQSSNSGSNAILYIALGLGAVIIIGLVIQHKNNNVKMTRIIKENDDLKNKRA
jgi:uncharacterized protein HemX